MKNIFVLVLLLFTLKEIIPQNINYFPISIGNEYQFVDDYSNYLFFKIEKDTVLNGKTYYYYPLEFRYCRTDSLGNIYSISQPFFGGGNPVEYLILKSDAHVGDTWKVAWDYNIVIDTGYAQCIYADTGYFFGKYRKIKGVKIFDASYNYYYFFLAEDLGLIENHYDILPSGGTLNYAKIDNVIYGKLVGIKDKIPEVQSFIVYQNYPNPFNSTTRIKVQFPVNSKNQYYKFMVYDVLGEKIYEKNYPISYSTTISFNSDNLNLKTGVYFYTIIYENSAVTKKFILLK